MAVRERRNVTPSLSATDGGRPAAGGDGRGGTAVRGGRGKTRAAETHHCQLPVTAGATTIPSVEQNTVRGERERNPLGPADQTVLAACASPHQLLFGRRVFGPASGRRAERGGFSAATVAAARAHRAPRAIYAHSAGTAVAAASRRKMSSLVHVCIYIVAYFQQIFEIQTF